MKIRLTLLALLAMLVSACNKNSNELPAPNNPNTSFLLPVTLFDNRSDILSATFSRYESASQDSLFVVFNNLSDGPLENLQLVVEISSALPPAYDNSRIYFNQTLTIAKGASSQRFGIAAGKPLPFESANFQVYVISCRQLTARSRFSGIYQNRYSAFRKGTTITAYPQLFGFVQVDGKAVFRIKLRDSLSYSIAGGQFQDDGHFSGSLMTGGQIMSYLSLDSASTVFADGRAQFRLPLSIPLPDSSDNLFIDALKN